MPAESAPCSRPVSVIYFYNSMQCQRRADSKQNNFGYGLFLPLFLGVSGHFWLFIFGDFSSSFSNITNITEYCNHIWHCTISLHYPPSEAMSAAKQGLRESNIDQGRDIVGAHTFLHNASFCLLVGECTPPYVFDVLFFHTILPVRWI